MGMEMGNGLLLWVRRNSARAVALLLAPGIAVLALDAFIEHYAGRSGEDPLQAVPVGYGAAAFFVLTLCCLVRPRAAFVWGARVVGAAGVVVGVWGAALHAKLFFEDLGGKWTMNTVEGALDIAPPLIAPLAFALVGGALIALTWSKLVLRIEVGAPEQARVTGTVVELPKPGSHATDDQERRAGRP